MTTSSGCLVSDLLPERFRHVDDVAKHALLRDHAIEQAHLPTLVTGIVGDKVTSAIRGALHCDAFGLLARAWAKARELHEFTDQTQHPPGQVSTVFLGEHPLSCQVHPTVEVTIGVIGKIVLRFDLTLSAQFKLAELTILDAHITQIGHSECLLAAQLSYDGVPLHDQFKSRDFTLSSAITLPEPGLRIL
jgi:hypothetical protein